MMKHRRSRRAIGVYRASITHGTDTRSRRLLQRKLKGSLVDYTRSQGSHRASALRRTRFVAAAPRSAGSSMWARPGAAVEIRRPAGIADGGETDTKLIAEKLAKVLKQW